MQQTHSLQKALGLEKAAVVAIIGGGGKTSLMTALGREYARSGNTVILTTSTHIVPPERDFYMGDDPAVLSAMLEQNRLLYVGAPAAHCRFGESPLMQELPRLADRVIVEADGTKGLPIKVPNEREPVIPAFADTVVAVAGLSALGRPVGEVCHRPELAAQVFGFLPQQTVTPEMITTLLTSPLAQKKGVGSRYYAVLLNQADAAEEMLIHRLAGMLLAKGVSHVGITALQKAPGEYGYLHA